MADARLIKTNFTAGEISPALLARADLRAYENGAGTLTNVTIHPTGGLSRRRGLYYVDTALGDGRLIAFEFNAEQTYLLVVTNQKITIYRQGLSVASVVTPWTLAQIKNITWTQSADTVLLCHPDVPPKVLTRLNDTSWTLTDWVFAKSDGVDVVLQPYYKFATEQLTLAASATTGSVTLTASAPVFQNDHVNTRIRLAGKELLLTAIGSSTVATATAIQTLPNTNATIDWQEQAFSAVRGYPICAVYHQDRLVIGGSRDLPNRLWFSQSGDLWNFDKGTGLDSHAIEFGLFSDQINTIRALFSGRHLQVFTSGAEWIVTGSPLTPTSIQLNRQTRIGSVMTRYIPPVDVDGATLFVGRTGSELREFIFADIEQAYQANDLALLARHLFDDPVDQCFDPQQRILFCPLSDGTLAALTIYRTESVSAWSRLETDGKVHSVATVGSAVYALVKRTETGLFTLERFDENVLLDACLSGSSVNPTATWSGLGHLEARTVMILADEIPRGLQTVIGGQITLATPARNVTIGLPYAHVIEPLPPSLLSTDGMGRAIRLVRATFRLLQTCALRVDVGSGLKDVALRRLSNIVLDEAAPPVTTDVTVRAFGWSKTSTGSVWRLEQDIPLPCTILGVTMELKVNE